MAQEQTVTNQVRPGCFSPCRKCGTDRQRLDGLERWLRGLEVLAQPHNKPGVCMSWSSALYPVELLAFMLGWGTHNTPKTLNMTMSTSSVKN